MRRVILLLVVLAVPLVILFRGSLWPPREPDPPPSTETEVRLRIGVTDRPACLPVRALRRLPGGEEVRLDVRPAGEPGWAWQLLAAGELDLVLTTLDDFSLAVPRHDPGVLILPSAYSQGSDAVLGAKGVEDLEQLDGQAIAYVPGSGGEYLLTSYLGSHPEVQPRLVEAVNAEEAAAWLRAGDVAAAAVWQPLVQSLQGEGHTILWDSRRDMLTEVWVASRQSLAAGGGRRPYVEALVREWFTLVRKLEEQPGLALRAVAEENGMEAAQVQLALQEGLYLLDLEDARRLDRAELLATLEDRLTLWSLRGAANARRVEYADVIDLGILERVVLPPRKRREEAGAPEPFRGMPEEIESAFPPGDPLRTPEPLELFPPAPGSGPESPPVGEAAPPEPPSPAEGVPPGPPSPEEPREPSEERLEPVAP